MSDLAAADAFGLLSDETRVEIIRALGDNRERDPDQRQFVPIEGERPNRLSYSTLKDSVGIVDNGRMNYHLNELLGVFLTEVADGYQLTTLGYQAYRYLVAGTFQWSEEFRVELDDYCFRCGSPYVADYGPSQFLRVGCRTCQDYYVGVHYPARGLTDRPIEAVIPAADRLMRSQYALMHNGVCHWCGGDVERSLDVYPGAEVRITGSSVFVTYSCLTCGNVRYNSLGGDLLGHPAVRRFHAVHGRPLCETRTWEIEFLRDDHVTVGSEDPLRTTVTMTLDGDTLSVTVTDDLNVSEIERSEE